MASPPVVHIIDDDDAVRDSLAMLLEVEDIPVATYPSGRAFLDRLPVSSRGCVVTDVQMPEMSGLDLLRWLKAQAIALPVIVVTARAGRARAAEALAQGAAAFIEKPFAPQALLDAVRAAMAAA